MNAIRSLWDNSVALRFVAVGGTMALLYFGICLVLTDVAGLSPFTSSMAAYFICFWVGYGFQRGVAFRSTASHSVTLTRYVIWHAFGATLVSLAAQAGTSASNLAPIYSALLATMLGGIMNFFISSRWIFRAR